MGSIRYFFNNGKTRTEGKISKDFLIIVIIVLVAAAGFGLGRLSLSNNQKTELKIGEIELNSVPASVYASQQKEEVQVTDGTVVASKNSTKYHYPWCSGAKRINEENKIYFNSIEEARAQGYEPAGNCKGLK